MKFKIKMICICLLVSTGFTSKLKAQVFEEGKTNFAVGYGFGTFYGAVLSDYQDESNYESTVTGPIYLKFESALSDKIGLGINLAYAKYSLSYNYTDFSSSNIYTETDSYTTFSILARMNVHFGDFDRFDPYWGVGVGYRSGKFDYKSTDPDGYNSFDVNVNFPFGFETTLGARYYFSDNIGMYLETGLAKSVLQVGLTFSM